MQQVLWAGFALSVLFGTVAQRTHFCTMGAVADIVNIGDWSRMHNGRWPPAWPCWASTPWSAWADEAKNTIYAAPRLLWLSQHWWAG